MNKRIGTVFGLALMTVVVMESCGGSNSESSSTANSDSLKAVEQGNTPVLGAEGDTANSSVGGPTQAPPDSADGGAIVPANVDVKKSQ